MTSPLPDFGRMATDYAEARLGFPEVFFDRLGGLGVFRGGDRVVDLGTGTGTIARGLARRGCHVIGLDLSAPLLEHASRLAHSEGLSIDWRCAHAEQTGLPPSSVHVVFAGQCWHWFDRAAAAREVDRILVPGGRVVIAHFDFVASATGLVRDTLALVRRFGTWPEQTALGIDGIYPHWLADLAAAGFVQIEARSWDLEARYSHESWCRRIHASAALCHLDGARLADFDAAYEEEVAPRYHEPLQVPHRIFIVMGVKALR